MIWHVSRSLESPPARGRGLKPGRTALRLGALSSPPARGRGLKLLDADADHACRLVAPRAGAWIETWRQLLHSQTASVAPRAGAWIETLSARNGRQRASPPARGRGLKQS